MEQGLAEKPSLTLTRRYPVAPEKVWRAWTHAETLKRWWAPRPGEPVSLAELDVRVGGRFRIVYAGAQGTTHEQFFDEKARDSHHQGWSAALENLSAFLQSST